MARDDDPLRALGLGPDADADDVRAARRRLARQVHPDAGGDNAAMASINDAAARALHELESPRDRAAGDDRGATAVAGAPDGWGEDDDVVVGSVRQHDIPSFTVEALPVETFEAMLVAAGWLGEVIDDDPPYRLDVHMTEPFECWCRFDVVPDAGASTVSLTVAAWAESPLAPVEQVRDVWVDVLNRLDWTALSDAAPPP
ncbi:MAG: hypothetical protein ABWZ42_00410 [Ilumatobacteraceae bacterium]